jgi:mannosyltransferase
MTLRKDILRDKNLLMALGAILLLGSALRFYGLGNQSLWNDELCTWHFSHYDAFSGVINEGLRPEVHPPAYYLLLRLVQKHIGDSESALRFPSAICGVLSIVAIFPVGLRLCSRREALIAAGLMAVLWCPIYYSQEARPEAMLLAFTLLATYFWLSILQSLDQNLGTAYYAISGHIVTATISAYLHYIGLYFIALQGLGAVLLLARRPRSPLRILLMYAIILLAYPPWLPTMVYQLTHNTGRLGWIERPAGTSFIEFLLFLFNYSMGLLAIVLILCLFTATVGVYSSWKSTRHYSMRLAPLAPWFILVAWLIVPFAGVYVESSLSAPLLEFRNLLASLPAAYLLLSRAIARLPLSNRNQAFVTVALLSLFLFDLVVVMNYYGEPYKEQFREAVNYIVERDHLYENSLIIGYAGVQAWQEFFDYHFQRAGFPGRVEAGAGQEGDISQIDGLVASKKPRYV